MLQPHHQKYPLDPNYQYPGLAGLLCLNGISSVLGPPREVQPVYGIPETIILAHYRFAGDGWVLLYDTSNQQQAANSWIGANWMGTCGMKFLWERLRRSQSDSVSCTPIDFPLKPQMLIIHQPKFPVDKFGGIADNLQAKFVTCLMTREETDTQSGCACVLQVLGQPPYLLLPILQEKIILTT